MTHAPAVSVIIPMYNAENFIAECLESLLIQTFSDYEIIVVDDCSTDNSAAIVERYIPKFGGWLKLSHMKKNSGSGAAPRNKGLILARGKYIFCVDADDLLTPTALEELFTAAEDFDADFVCVESYYEANDDLSKIFVATGQKGRLVNAPTVETENLAGRVQALTNRKFSLTTWNKFVKRDLIIEHEIFFPHVAIAEDDIWTYALIFYAKKILRVPNVVYVWRHDEKSVMRRKRTPQETLKFWLSPIVFGIKTLDDFMSRIEFFRLNPQYRCAALEFLVHTKIAQLFDAAYDLPLPEIYSAIKNSFGSSLGKHDVLISWLLTDLIIQQKNFFIMQHKINELEARQ